jgi:hypothetical protein
MSAVFRYQPGFLDSSGLMLPYLHVYLSSLLYQKGYDRARFYRTRMRLIGPNPKSIQQMTV